MNQKKTKVLVWYIGEIEGIKVGHTYEHGGYEISFSYVGAPATVSPPFTDFDIIILPFGVFISDDGSIQYPDEYTKRKLELIKFIKSKNKITCFLFPLRETFVKLSHMKTRFNNPFPYLVPSDLSAYALSEYKSQFFLSEDVRNNESKYKIARSEFADFLNSYGSTCISWLLNEGGERILMVEVKGLSANLDRASVSQANNNRDRQGYDENLPALVIANTFMRNPQTIADKRQHIHEDIVKYAEKLNVRLMRTIDLLDFLNQIFEKRITKEDFVKRVVSERGWIKA